MEPDNNIVVDKTKKPKGSIIAIIILSILAVGGITLGIFGLIQNHQKSEEISRLKETTATGTVVTAPESVEDETTEDIQPKEIEITNGYVLRDLRHKIGVLHGINNRMAEKKDTFVTSLSYNFIERVYTNSLDAIQKSSIALRGELKKANLDRNYYKDDYFTKLKNYINGNEFLSTWLQSSSFTQNYNYITDNLEYISYEAAEDLYKQLFGNSATIEKADIMTKVCGQNYLYISDTNGFTLAPGGCGGAGFPLVFVKIDDYKAKANEAYVDIRAASAPIDEGYASYSLYDGLYYRMRNGDDNGNHDTSNLPESGDFKNGKVIATISSVGQGGDDVFDEHGQIGDQSADVIFDKYGDSIKKYRFVFKMNADGTFYFSHVENL